MKMGLNRKEQVLAAKWQAEGVKPEAIAKKFGTSADIVKKFTQKALDEAAAKASDRAAKAAKAAKVRQQKAAIVKEVLTPDEGDFS